MHKKSIATRIPCRVQPSARLSIPHRRVVIASSTPDRKINNLSSADEWGEGSSEGSSSDAGQQQQQQQQQRSWGSSWAGRTSSNKSNKPVSFFSQRSEFQDKKSGKTSVASDSGQADPQLEASIRQNVDRAAHTLQDVIDEVLNELLIDEASSYVLDEEGPSLQLNQAVRNAVVKRLEWLDANFLAALNAYLAAPSVAANKELRALLSTVRDEVLDLVSARLPPSVQVLNAALAHSSRSGRSKVVASALAGGGGSLPGATLEALGAAATQLVEDMEDQQVIADRVLLARLVLLREELRLLAEQEQAQKQFFSGSGGTAPVEQQGGSANGSGQTSDNMSDVNKCFAFHRSNLPARCAAFMKELLLVPERDRRLGLITKAFQEDWVGESPSLAQASEKPSKKRTDNNFSHQRKNESLDIVRPGRFFSTLLAMQAELEQQLVGPGPSARSSEQTLALLRQMEAIRLESLAAVDRIQHNRRAAAGTAGGGLESSNDALDYEMDLV